MKRNPDMKRRERVIGNWQISQAAAIFGLVLSVLMPFAWGWPEQVARGTMSWLDIGQTTALSWVACLGGGETIRRLSNRQFGQPVCKWIWQK
jgi:hypothetical protein